MYERRDQRYNSYSNTYHCDNFFAGMASFAEITANGYVSVNHAQTRGSKNKLLPQATIIEDDEEEEQETKAVEKGSSSKLTEPETQKIPEPEQRKISLKEQFEQLKKQAKEFGKGMSQNKAICRDAHEENPSLSVCI